jgi:hypothetical protein
VSYHELEKMMAKSISNMQIKDLVVSLALFLLPVVFLALSLATSGYWSSVLDALLGRYAVYGVPSNPWREWLPFFLLAEFAFVLPSCLAIVLVRGLGSSFLGLVTNVCLNLLASVAFGFSMVLASIFYLWFWGPQIVGSVGSSFLFWSSMSIAFALQLANGYRIARQTSEVS